MTGFEFLKRFTFEQVVVYFFKIKKATASLIGGGLFALCLIAGSFYMSLHGSHRLIDQTEAVNQYSDTTIQQKVDSMSVVYNNRIIGYQKLIDGINESAVDGKLRNKDKADVKAYEAKISDLQSELEKKTNEVENKVLLKANTKLESTKDNTTALVMLYSVYGVDYIVRCWF